MDDRVVGNYVKINRQMLEWRFWYSETAVKLWILLLLKANWKDGWFMGTPVPRGSLATSMSHLADECGFHRNTVIKWLNRFEEDGQITRTVCNRFTVITIINYGFFQDIPDDYVQRDVQQHVQPDVQQDVQQRVHNRRKKEGKKERKEEKRVLMRETSEPPTADEVNEYAKTEGLALQGSAFVDYYSARGWKLNGEQIHDWRALARIWSRKEDEFKKKTGSRGRKQDVLPEYYDPDPERKPKDNEKMSQQELDEMKALLQKTKL